MLIAADSFTVRNGKVRGLGFHITRFADASGMPSLDVFRAVEGVRGSPRLEYTEEGFYVRQRPARPETDTVEITGTVLDERTKPLVKGPDLEWLASVKPDDGEAWLVDKEGLVVEACFAAPVLFEGGKALIPIHKRQLRSVTSMLVISAFGDLKVPFSLVPPRPPSAYESGWLLNSTHIRRFGDAPEDLRQDVIARLDAEADPI